MNTRQILSLIGLSTLSAAPLAAQRAWAFAPRSARTTDAIIARDIAWFDSLERVSALPRTRAYVALAREAYERNDSGSLSISLLEASTSTVPTNSALSVPAAAGSTARTGATASVRGARSDLWQLVDSLRTSSALSEPARNELVALEVALVRAASPLLGAPSCNVWEREAERIASMLRRPATPSDVAAPRPMVAPVPAPLRALTGVPNRVHFALDRSLLSIETERVLRAIADSLSPLVDVVIVVEGHTDKRASDAYNQALSERRAEAVRRYLIEHGIAESRIKSEPLGESRLDLTGVSAADHARNRRVVLRYRSVEGREIMSVEQFGDVQPEAKR